MKKLLLILLVFLSCLYANAQSPTPKGKFFTGGGFSYNRNQSDFWPPYNFNFYSLLYDKTNILNLRPQVGHMLTDNWAIGLGVNYQRAVASAFYDDGIIIEKTTQNLITIFPFVRYYAQINNKFSFFSEANVGYGRGTLRKISNLPDQNGEPKNEISNNNLSSFDINIRPGINFFITDRIVIEGTIGRLGYTSVKGTQENENSKSTTFEFGINPRAFSLGVFYWFK